MELRILSPKTHRTLTVDWVEIMTPTGSMVIQSFHAPLIANIVPNSTVIAAQGEQKITINVSIGSVKVALNIVTLLMHEE
jgi:F0F1-type ATP synthase epsilon subunit